MWLCAYILFPSLLLSDRFFHIILSAVADFVPKPIIDPTPSYVPGGLTACSVALADESMLPGGGDPKFRPRDLIFIVTSISTLQFRVLIWVLGF